MSDLVSNVTRGILAEYIVGHALCATADPREQFAPYDLLMRCGTRVEVRRRATSRRGSRTVFPRPRSR